MIIFAATKEKQTFRVVEFPEEEINELISVMRNNLQVEEFVNFDKKSYRQYTDASHQLYKKLLKPVWEMTEERDLVIIPDGMLGYIPFKLFLTDSVNTGSLADKMDYKNLPYLLKKKTISYAYSSTLLFSDIKEKTPDRKRVLAMAPSYENISNTPVDSIFNRRQGGEILLPIPGISTEVKNISNTYKSTVFRDTLATEKTFKREAPEYSVLHLAMHAIVDDENPMYSKLVFYQDSANKNQGLLNTYELFELSLSAEMAVLSACNTGYGKLQRGEGIMSLARGFLYAGVPNVVMTLWPIEDESTSKIMNLFYKELAKGKEKDEALRQAKLRFLENTDMLNAHPHFWGSFVTIGPDTPIKNINKKTDTVYWIGGVLLLIAVGGIIIRRFR
ncbi:MAG: CHAT domain-containing protein [Bacteroidales bacterium]|nr:CHAT domain-containing protein [Bacteroidales bacterium]